MLFTHAMNTQAEEGYSYGYAADIFSIGAVVYELMTGFPPFPCGPPPLQRQPAVQLQAQPRDVPHEGAKEDGSKAQHGGAQGAGEDAGSDGLRGDGLGVAAVAAEGSAAAGRKSDDYDAEALLRLAPHPLQQQPHERHKEEEAQGTADAAAASCAAEKEQPEESSNASRPPVTPLRGSSVASAKGASLGTAIAGVPGAGKPPPLSRGSSSTASPPLAFPSSVSPAARSFIRTCLEPHPGDRASIDQLMVHEWVVNAQQVRRVCTSIMGCRVPYLVTLQMMVPSRWNAFCVPPCMDTSLIRRSILLLCNGANAGMQKRAAESSGICRC